jgi:hypothetical protein
MAMTARAFIGLVGGNLWGPRIGGYVKTKMPELADRIFQTKAKVTAGAEGYRVITVGAAAGEAGLRGALRWVWAIKPKWRILDRLPMLTKTLPALLVQQKFGRHRRRTLRSLRAGGFWGLGPYRFGVGRWREGLRIWFVSGSHPSGTR